jgi:transposase
MDAINLLKLIDGGQNMSKLPKQSFTQEFRDQAVKSVLESQLSIPEAARRLNMSAKTLANWVHKSRLSQKGDDGLRKPVTELEAEISRLRRELAEARMERDVLKKATAYFAKESLQGTRS